MSTTRTFMSGRSQAIRIPKEYRLPDEEIFVNCIGSTVTLTPVSMLRQSFENSIDLFTEDFMADGRPQQTASKRDAL